MKKILDKITALLLALCMVITSMNMAVIHADAAEASVEGLKTYIAEALPGVNDTMKKADIPLSMGVDNKENIIKVYVHDEDAKALELLASMTALTDLFKYEGIESVEMEGVRLNDLNMSGSLTDLVASIKPILEKLGAPTSYVRLKSYKLYTMVENNASIDVEITLKNKDVVVYTLKILAPEEVKPTCPDCGSTDHIKHPTCPDCGSKDHTKHPTCPDCGSKDHTKHPTCPDCGSKDHTKHPTCPDCGSKDHTKHPTCPDCGSKDHTKHPTCPDCGSKDHTKHPSYEAKASKLKIASKSTSAIKITWSAPSKKYAAPKGYEVQQIAADGKLTKKTTTKKQYTFNSLKSGSAYTYKVTPYILAGKTKVYGKTITVKGVTTPKKVQLSKVSGAKQSINVTWKTTTATGYQLTIATNKKFSKGVKKYNVTSTKKTISKKISKLDAKKTYYVKVRAYAKNGNTTSYSAWSNVKTVKTK